MSVGPSCSQPMQATPASVPNQTDLNQIASSRLNVLPEIAPKQVRRLRK